ncbi:hypothetical protein IU459_34240 [Nocardia amamiensis]|uniref:Uncharacterized protein n=1 Tax=Nocardia amamiensis TaxID=404578 RepID=A0ABS0D619_9NOCA|nr:hypothetical protein [Nocardia amamiensis]MBF6302563.1 hypothetical protein [Nocardia amamiensis]
MRQRGTFPQRGEFGDLSLDLSDSQKELAQAVRGLIEQIGLSGRAIEEAIAARLRERDRSEGYLSKSVLFYLANGRHKRPPREAPLRELHTLALDSCDTEGMVITWDELNSLRLALSLPSTEDEHQPTVLCPTCGAAMTLEEARALEQVSAATKPAEISPVITTDVVPVPHHVGDRHNTGTIDVAWPPAKDLAVYISAGNFERVNGLIRYVGTEAAPDETADAVVSCRKLGLDEATDTIINYAGSRSELDVLQILQSLNQRDQRPDADTLLERALASSMRLRSS